MKDRRRPAAHISHERWLVSYADFVTLLFAFFVVLYASAQIDKRKAVRLSEAIETAFQQLGAFQKYPAATGPRTPGTAKASDAGSNSTSAGDPTRFTPSSMGEQDGPPQQRNFDAIRAELEKALAPEIKRNEVALHIEGDGLIVSLREVGFFNSGSASIKPGAEAAFTRVAMILREHSCAVRIEGHTDIVPIHTPQFASNWELSTARATELVKSLIENHGLSAQRLSAAGYAEFHPVATNDSPKGRQLNRRVDVVILAMPMRPQLVPNTNLTSAENTAQTANRPGPRIDR
jgi:chemotaxis protein MotB